MKKTLKILVIIAVLLAPVLVFLFLKRFGENRFELPEYYPEGNPIAECNAIGQPHSLSEALIFSNIMKLPALFYFVSNDKGEYVSDLENVFSKYPAITVRGVIKNEQDNQQQDDNLIILDSLAYMQFINCELILGEDRWLDEPIFNKYVLIDVDAKVRGYFDANELSEIERLDTELDILLNY